jgi:quercetin dioxygenase-like cupin family protein
MAKAKVMIDNEKTRVTEWVFDIGDETGQHIHEFDYVVVPMLDGELKIINHDGEETISKLLKGDSYYRNKGVNHNVINNNKYEYSFIEIEFKL